MTIHHSIRLGALAAALAFVLPAVHAADTPAVSKVNLATLHANGRYDRFIVNYRSGSTERGNQNAVLQNVKAAVSRAGLARASTSAAAPFVVSYKHHLAIGAEVIKTSRKLSQNEAAELMRQIASDPAVAHVEVDAMLHAVRDFKAPTAAPKALLSAAPDDPYYANYQWHFNNATGGADVENAWAKADGSDVVVAVIDTGITQHSDLDESLADDGYDFITDSFVSGRDSDGRVAGGWDTGDWTTGDTYLATNGGCVDDDNPAEASSWHGTHVAGTIAELTDNGVGMAGIAHDAKVLPVRVLGHCGGYTSDIADAIEWASGGHVDGVPDNTHPAQVINMSLGGGGTCSADDVTGKAIADAIGRGVTVVVAAGNSDDDAVNYTPASCPGVIVVASNGITGKRAFYSNYGDDVTLSAPGGGIYKNDASSGTQANPEGFVWSTVNDGETTPTTEDYGGMAGTSQATPHVTGTVALILGAEKQAGVPLSTPAQIKSILTATARPFPVTEDEPIGAGIVDAAAAVQSALGDGSSPGEPPADGATALSNGSVLGGQGGSTGSSALYALDVPAGAGTLNLRTYGGTGDVSIYVKAGSAPAADGSDADYASSRPGNTETVVVAKPEASTYYVRVVGVKAYANLSVLGLYR